MKVQYYCWREIDPGTGFAFEFLDDQGNITRDAKKRIHFEWNSDAEFHCRIRNNKNDFSGKGFVSKPCQF